jgi:hypothetical protein
MENFFWVQAACRRNRELGEKRLHLDLAQQRENEPTITLSHGHWHQDFVV